MRRIVATLSATVLAVVAGLSAATPAHADFSWCPAGKFCMATSENGNGTKWSYWVSAQNGGVEMATGQRSQVSSVWNRTGGNQWMYQNPTCTGPGSILFNPGQAFNLVGTSWDNATRSFWNQDSGASPLNGVDCFHKNG
jgi:hypothetical protein